MHDKRIRKIIEGHFYNYNDDKRYAANYLSDYADEVILSTPQAQNGHGSGVGNPTESKAIKLAQAGERFKWCRVVEMTIEHFAHSGKDELIRLKYFQKTGEVKICDRLFIDRSVVYEWLDSIITHAAMLALDLRLIKMIPDEVKQAILSDFSKKIV